MLAAVPKLKRLKDPKLIKKMRSDRCEICRDRVECEVHQSLFFDRWRSRIAITAGIMLASL